MLIFVLADGDPTKAAAIGEMSYIEAVRWGCLADYQSYAVREQMKER